MSKKNRRKGGGQGSAEALLERARRQLGKGDARQTLKDARVLYRRAATPAHRQLLEEAYVARAEQLYRVGLLDQAGDALRELTQLGSLSEEVESRVAQLRPFLGIVDGTAPKPAELEPLVAQQLADQAVLHPERIPSVYGEIAEQAGRVRQTLEAIERGDDPAAAERLQDISHKSPFADWKLLVRGLSAHYVGETARRDMNWERLSPSRAPYRIAQTLLVDCGAKEAQHVGFDTSTRLRRLQYARAGDTAIRQLQELVEHGRQQRWEPLLRGFRIFAARFAKTHAPIIGGLTDVLWRHFVRYQEGVRLQTLASFVPPPPLDPQWNRARALLAEQERHCDLDQIERLWTAYAADLAKITSLREQDRNIAVALVHLQLARHFRDAAVEHAEMLTRGESDGEDRSQIRQLQRDAVQYYRTSLRHYPPLLAAHEELGRMYVDWEQPENAVTAYKVLLQQFPTHQESIAWLANYFLEEDRPSEAEPYVAEMHRLRPRDRNTLMLLWNQRIAMVRHYTRKRKFDLARRELEAAAADRHRIGNPLWLDAIRATIEYKSRQEDEAERYVAEAMSRVPDPTAVWMIMHACAVRYGLDRQWKKEFSARFQAAAQERCSSESAGQMAEFLHSFLLRHLTYTGFVTHQRTFRRYLKRCTRVPWQAADLVRVCRYLAQDSRWGREAWRWLAHFASMGIRLFPRDPYFHYFAGVEQMERGPYGCDVRRAIHCFEEALRLNTPAASPLEPQHVADAKRSLTLLRDRHHSFPAELFGFGFDDDDDDDDDEADDWDDEYDSDADDNDGGMSWANHLAGLPEELRSVFLAMMEGAIDELGLDPEEVFQRFAQAQAEGRFPPDMFSAAGDAAPEPRRAKQPRRS